MTVVLNFFFYWQYEVSVAGENCVSVSATIILREHLKYVWNVHCVVTNHRRDPHTTETTDNARFPITNKLFSFCFNIRVFFACKQLLFRPICSQYVL